MSGRRRIIAGNWKMYKTVPEALELVNGLKPLVADVVDTEVVVCPPFTALYPVRDALSGSNIGLGAQDVFWEKEGAYTGEIAVAMLKDVGCSYCIVGHSERRKYFGETDEMVNKKARALLDAGIKPIICVGETLEEREAGNTESVITRQVRGALAGFSPDDGKSIVFAYEPVWAIGTGHSADGKEANRVIRLIRDTAAEILGGAVAQGIRIQYGGSVKPENIAEFLGQPEIDGALVGGASLKASLFAQIVKEGK